VQIKVYSTIAVRGLFVGIFASEHAVDDENFPLRSAWRTGNYHRQRTGCFSAANEHEVLELAWA